MPSFKNEKKNFESIRWTKNASIKLFWPPSKKKIIKFTKKKQLRMTFLQQKTNPVGVNREKGALAIWECRGSYFSLISLVRGLEGVGFLYRRG
jgi:hypothetical protein